MLVERRMDDESMSGELGGRLLLASEEGGAGALKCLGGERALAASRTYKKRVVCVLLCVCGMAGV